MSLGSSLDASSKVGIHPTKHLIGIPANTLVSTTEVAGDFADKVLLLAGGTAQDLPKTMRLNVVLGGNRVLLSDNCTGPSLVLPASLDGAVGKRAEGGGVGRVGAVVAVHVHVTIAMGWVKSFERAVGGYLLVVTTQAVALCVWVGEETSLEDWVGRGLDTGDHVRRREGGLFNFREVVMWVFVEGEAAEATQGHVFLRPDFRQVEDVPAGLLCLLRAQDLHIAGPGGALTALDRVQQILGVPVGVLGG